MLDSLQTFLEERCTTTTTTTGSDDDADAGATRPVGANAVTANAIGVSRSSSSSTQGGRPILILHGLAPTLVHMLLAAAPLGIDADFIEAHGARRRYPPRRRHRRRHLAGAAQWNYPELVGGLLRAMWARQGGFAVPIGDGLGRAAVRAVSDCEDLAAVESRASVWVGERVDVLFLDQPVWEAPEGSFKKARRKKRMSAMAVLERRVDEIKERDTSPATKEKEEEDEEIPSLEDALQERISLSADATGSTLVDILEEEAYEKWLEFFEVLTPQQTPLTADGSSLEWRALQALEQNVEMANSLAPTRRRHDGPTDYSPPDWSSLLQRLRDRTALLSTIPQQAPAALSLPPVRRDDGGPIFRADNFTNLPAPRHRPRTSRPPATRGDRGVGGGSGGDENQRALDRVTYLGGILLPISIVSSVLSMNEDFEPGHSLFWVFWAAAVPLTLTSLAIIYADKLRSVEVWQEIGSLGSGPSWVDHAVEDGNPGGGEGKKKGKKKKTTETETHELAGYPEHEKWGRLAVDERDERHRQRQNLRPLAISYAGGEDVVIDLSDAVAPSQPITLEPRTSQHQQQRPHEEDVDIRPPSIPPSDQHPSSVDSAAAADDDIEYDEDLDPNMYITRPTNGERPHAWRKKQLGWGGAAMCILRMQKPLRVEDGLPVATGPRRAVERRRQQVRRKASAERRRSLSY
ncbi:hypothetical protein N0V82_002489 [Gnomoniopsis sp. IMI 355080]|nr:hypothetical protein N0V82_002489 [Gnomoniopsis sp. IMI 355080]